MFQAYESDCNVTILVQHYFSEAPQFVQACFHTQQLAWVGTVADSDGSHHARRASLFNFGIVLSKIVPGHQKGRRASLGLVMKTFGLCARANGAGTSDA